MKNFKNRIPLKPLFAPNVNPKLIQRIFNFVRIDGKLTGDYCFLSIEDGGSFEHVNGLHSNLQKHIDELEKYTEQQPWSPEKDTILKVSGRPTKGEELVGSPGGKIAKIMFNLTGKGKDSTEYLRKHLYRANEFNVKFYPLCKPKQNIWYKYWDDIGLTDYHYQDWCVHNRCEVIFNQYGKIILDSKVIVIIGAREEWLRCLAPALGIDFTRTEYYSGKNYNYHFYFSSKNELKASYINCFQRGLSDESIFKYTQKLIYHSDWLRNKTSKISFKQWQTSYSQFFPSFSNLKNYLNQLNFKQYWLESQSVVTDSIHREKQVNCENISLDDFKWLCEKNDGERRYLGM
jgi:hypothetical protein